VAFLFWMSSLLCLLRLWLSLYGGIHPDEAYYWTWAQNLHIGYYDHPPLVAYIIRIGQEIFEAFWGSNYAGAKAQLFLSFRWLPDVLGYILLPCLLGASIQEYQKKDLSLSQVFGILSTPLILFGAQIITPDLPLFIIWTGSFLVSLKMKRRLRKDLEPKQPTPFSLKYSLIVGILWTLGGYSKYTAIFIPLLFIISGIGFWNLFLAGITCLILFSPYIYWTLTSALTNHMGIFYQLDRGTSLLGTSIHLNWVADLWAAQLLFWSPLFCFDYLLRLRSKKLMSWSMGSWIFLPLVFFSITGLRNRPEANWPAMGGIALSVYIIARLGKRPLRMFWYTTLHYFLVIVALWALLNQTFVGKLVAPFHKEIGEKLQKKVSRIEEFRGWQNLRNLLFEFTLIDKDQIIVEKYHVISPLLFYDKSVNLEEKLKDRLKIDKIPNRSVSQFHFEDSFTPDYRKSYWFLKKGEGIPENKRCELRQSFVKADPMGEPFTLYKCKSEN
jgi:hypothetical protein